MNGRILLSSIMILIVIGCVAPTPAPPSAGCVDFSGYPDNTQFGNPFTLNAYQFMGLGATPFVNVNGNVVGLQFADGLEISIPSPASSVSLDVASFAQPMRLFASDSNGMTVAIVNVPADKTVHKVTLSGQGIVKIMIKGGNHEGILVKICS